MALLLRLSLGLWIGDNDLAKMNDIILRRDEALIFCAPFRKRECYDIGGSIHTSIGSIKFVDSFIVGKRLTPIYLGIYQFY